MRSTNGWRMIRLALTAGGLITGAMYFSGGMCGGGGGHYQNDVTIASR